MNLMNLTNDLIVLTLLLIASYIALKWADGRLRQKKRKGEK